MMLDRVNYDWETREDAETLMRANQIKKDPQRLAKAKECISASLSEMKSVAGSVPDNTPTRHNNPATIKKLNYRQR